MSAGPERTEPATPTPATPPSSPSEQPTTPQAPAVTPSMAAFGGNEACPNCGAGMAADQRYCLNCGHRRGDPRLPFMDAVVFMESMNTPPGAGAPPPPPTSSGGGPSPRWNANAALIAGVATLVLAIGVGFLIGRSGHDNAPQAAAAPQIIKVGGGGEEGGGEEAGATEEAEAGGKEKNAKSKNAKSGSKGSKQPKPSEIKEGSKQEEEVAQEKTDEVLHTENGVKIETKAEVGGKCEKGAAGCSESGEFTGNFFGE